jgi:hypothetical protein
MATAASLLAERCPVDSARTAAQQAIRASEAAYDLFEVRSTGFQRTSQNQLAHGKYTGQRNKYGSFEGLGILQKSNAIISGLFAEGKPMCCVCVWSSGDTYTGDFSDGKLHGLGRYFYRKTETTYLG